MFLLEASYGPSRDDVPPSLAVRPPLLRLVYPSKSSGRSSAAWVQRPRLAVHPPRGLRHIRHVPFVRNASFHELPLRCRVSPGLPCTVVRCVRSHEVSRPLSATQPVEPPFPGLPPPGHVASPHFPRASTPCSRTGLPGLFQPGALSGFGPSELSRAGIAPPLDGTSPLAIGLRMVAWPGDAGPRVVSPVPDVRPGLPVRTSPVGCPVWSFRSIPGSSGSLTAHARPSRQDPCPRRRGLASGVSSPCRLGPPRPNFSGARRPGSPGFLLPGAFFPGLGSRREAGSSSQVLRSGSRSGSSFPVLQSVKEPGNSASSPEASPAPAGFSSSSHPSRVAP